MPIDMGKTKTAGQTFIAKTVTLSLELWKHADKKVKEHARATGEPENLSKYFRDRIRRDMEAEAEGGKAA